MDWSLQDWSQKPLDPKKSPSKNIIILSKKKKKRHTVFLPKIQKSPPPKFTKNPLKFKKIGKI
jgi:hypothetical protein